MLFVVVRAHVKDGVQTACRHTLNFAHFRCIILHKHHHIKLCIRIATGRVINITREIPHGQYNWSTPIYNNIDWTAHYMSIKKSSMPHKFIIKFIHGWLPIGNMTHGYHTKYDAKCPSCLHNPEHINHFLRCPTRREWKTSLFARLVQYFTHMSTQPALADLVQECLRQWLHTDSPAFLNQSPQHTPLLTQQAQIRWDQLFQGWFSKQWSIIQHDYISQL